jgi:hypothetical protein
MIREKIYSREVLNAGSRYGKERTVAKTGQRVVTGRSTVTWTDPLM